MLSTGSSNLPVSIELRWKEKLIGKEPMELFGEISFPRDLVLLQRKIEELYQKLPWPPALKNVVLMTEVRGGRGDIAAAAKIINLMYGVNPDGNFTWVLPFCTYDALSFLRDPKPAQLAIGDFSSPPKITEDKSILITGPVKCGWGTKYIEANLQTKLQGVRFGFLENAEHI